MKWLKSHSKTVVLGLLVLTNIVIWTAYWARRPGDKLSVYFLDVGQGDAIFIDTPNHSRVILDGGPTRRVLTELGKIMPFGNKRIDLVIESHPDADHITGLVDVLGKYDVGAFMEPRVNSDNSIHTILENKVSEENVPKLIARRGMVVDFHDGAKLEILFPNQDVTNWETNDASIVAKLVYGDESFLLTGDSTKKAEYILLGLNKGILKSTVLKAGHHGSKGSTSLVYAQAVAPEYGVISAGAGNKYGHPTAETLLVLNQVGAKSVATESAGGLTGLGTIHFETDGKSLRLK
jgi:competence protein ComEC